jgi:hypothetical protein
MGQEAGCAGASTLRVPDTRAECMTLIYFYLLHISKEHDKMNRMQSRNKQHLLKMANLEELFELSLSVPLKENENTVSAPCAQFPN